MTRRKGFTLAEVITVTVIVATLAALLTFVLAPILNERGTKAVCASNMRQLITGIGLYMNDHDLGLPPNGVGNLALASYLIRPESKLFCPKSRRLNGKLVSAYTDELDMSQILSREPKSQTVFGYEAPQFDSDRDAILKCTEHTQGRFFKNGVAVYYGQPNLTARVQSIYLDGHLQFAPLLPCWRLPMEADNADLINNPALVPQCEGTLVKG